MELFVPYQVLVLSEAAPAHPTECRLDRGLQLLLSNDACTGWKTLVTLEDSGARMSVKFVSYLTCSFALRFIICTTCFHTVACRGGGQLWLGRALSSPANLGKRERLVFWVEK